MTCALPVIRSHSTSFPCGRWWIDPLTSSFTTSGAQNDDLPMSFVTKELGGTQSRCARRSR